MAKLSQKQLEEMAKEKKLLSKKKEPQINIQSTLPQSKIMNEIMGDKNTQLYKYSLPETTVREKDENSIPLINPNDYPDLNIRGKVSRKRQAKGYNLFLSNEINHVLQNVSHGTNRNATLNFLVWVGLQTLKGMNQPVNIRVHDDTYPDGEIISEYITKENEQL